MIPILLIACGALLFITGAVAGNGVQNNGLFALDRNTLPNTCGTAGSAGDDWAALYKQAKQDNPPINPPCHSDAFSFVPDGTGSTDHSYWSQGGSKDAYDPALGPWLWKPNDVSPDKNDIVNAFAAMYHTGSVATNDLKRFIYFGSDRFAVNGDAQQGFQFLQNATCLAGQIGSPPVPPNSDAACPSSTPSTPNTTCTPAFTGNNAGYFVDPVTGCPAHHKNGDLLILVNFNNGGTLGLAGVYEWWGADGAGAGCYGTPPVNPQPGVCDTPVVTGSGTDCATNTSTDLDFCATSNTSDLAGEPIWPYTGKNGVTSYKTSAFIEGGLNLAKIPGAGQCFPTFVAETRSSSGPSTGLSLQAQLKDLVMGKFQLCGATISIAPNGVNAVGSNHTFTVTVSKTVAGTLSPVAGVHPVVTLKRSDGTTLTAGTDNCAGGSGTDANGQCTVIFTSNSADVITGHAAADVTIDGATFHVETDGTAPNSGDAVKRFVDANVLITPNGVNEVNHAHTFTITTNAFPSGTTPSLNSIVPSVSTGSILNSTCGSPSGSGNQRTCHFDVNSSTAGTVTANASASWLFTDNDANPNPATATVVRSTSGTAGPGGSGSVTKRFVDANVLITPNGVNEVNHAHTFTITTNAFPAGSTPSLNSIVPSVSTGSISNSNCDSPTGTGNQRTCHFDVNSSTAGTVTANASASWHFVDPDANSNPASVDVVRSTSGTAGPGGSGSVTKRFVDANISITPLSDVNEVNHQHVFTITSTAFPAGTTDTITSIAPSISPQPSSYSTTCNAPVQNAHTATCTVTINSTSAGVFTLNATAVWHFVDPDANAVPPSVDVTRSTSGNSGPGGSGPATKRYVDAYITIGPPPATNNVGEPHTFVVNVWQDDGLPANTGGGDAATGFGPAPDGTGVLVALSNHDGANWQYVAPGDTCAVLGVPPNVSGGTIGGACGVTFSSPTAGTVTGHASVTFLVGGESLTRETDGVAPNSGDAIKHFVAGSIAWTKVDNGNRLQGGATFQLCQTYTYVIGTGLVALQDPICQTVVDKTPDNQGTYTGKDEDGAAGKFLVSGLPLGRYTVQETVAPPGFEPDLSTKTGDLVPGSTEVTISTAFVNRRPVLKIAGFGYTNAAVDPASQPDGIVKGSTTYTVTLHNYGTAVATLSNSSLVVSSNANCGASNTLALSGTVAVGADSSPFTLTCTYDHPSPAKIVADLVVKYTTNNLEREASGSPAEIFFTVNPN